MGANFAKILRISLSLAPAKLLPFGKTQIHLVFRSLIRIFANNLSFGSYKMELDRKLCATRRKFLDALAPRRDCSRGRSQQAGWTIALDVVSLYANFSKIN